jgi:hypothetical protein
MKLSLNRTLANLRQIGFEIRGLAYLIKLKKKDEVSTAELEIIYYGIGSLLNQLGMRVDQVIDQMEEELRVKK